MNHEGSSASDLVFARHTTSDAATGFTTSTASPISVSTIVRNQTIIRHIQFVSTPPPDSPPAPERTVPPKR